MVDGYYMMHSTVPHTVLLVKCTNDCLVVPIIFFIYIIIMYCFGGVVQEEKGM